MKLQKDWLLMHRYPGRIPELVISLVLWYGIIVSLRSLASILPGVGS